MLMGKNKMKNKNIKSPLDLNKIFLSLCLNINEDALKSENHFTYYMGWRVYKVCLA